MRKLYKYTVDNVIEVVNQNEQLKIPVATANELVASGSAILYETHEELNETINYQKNRRDQYPEVVEQLDLLYHEIIVSGSLTSSGSWAQSIKAVKDANPKP